MKRRLIIRFLAVALFALAGWWFSQPRIEVHGQLSSRDVAQISSEIKRLNRPAFFRKPSLANVTRLPRDLRDSVNTRLIAIYAESDKRVTAVTSTRHDEMSISLRKNENGWSISPIDDAAAP